MKLKKVSFPWTRLLVVLLLCALALSVVAIQKLSESRTSGYKLPKGWETRIVDETRCVWITVRYHADYTGTIQDYMEKVAFKMDIDEWVRNLTDPYDIQSARAITFGPLGVGNYNTIYLKSASNSVFSVEVSDSFVEDKSRTRENAECLDFEPVVRQIVRSLL